MDEDTWGSASVILMLLLLLLLLLLRVRVKEGWEGWKKACTVTAACSSRRHHVVNLDIAFETPVRCGGRKWVRKMYLKRSRATDQVSMDGVVGIASNFDCLYH